MRESDSPDLQIGSVLVQAGLITRAQLGELLEVLKDDPSVSLRTAILARGWASPESLDAKLRSADSSHSRTLPFPVVGPTGTVAMPMGAILPDEESAGRAASAPMGPTGTVALPPSVRPPVDPPVPASGNEAVDSKGLPAEVAQAAALERNRFGKYVLIRVLGSGGMAVVHKAWDTLLHQFVALKFLKLSDFEDAGPEEGKVALETFLAEARLAVKLNHPNIARVYELGEVRGRHYMAQYFIDGPTLQEVIHGTKERSLETRFQEDPKRFITILRDITSAMAYAHELQPPIIHRDLKPQNVMLDTSGRAYVVDFGLAKEVKAGAHSVSGYVKGTPKYMAPEQAEARSHAMDARTDIWALGVILYEMLTGRAPFEAGNLHELLSMIVTDEPTWPRHVANLGTAKVQSRTAGAVHVPRDLETIAMKCLQKDPRHRYQSARELAADLGRFLEGTPVSLPQHSAYWLLARWARSLRRNRAIGTAVLLAAIALGGLTWTLTRARPASDIASASGVSTEELRKVEGARDAFLRKPSSETLVPLAQMLNGLAPARAAVAREGIGSWWQEYWRSREATARSLYAEGQAKQEWLDPRVRQRAEALRQDLSLAEAVRSRRISLGLPDTELGPTQDRVRQILEWKGTFTLIVDIYPWARFRLLLGGKEVPRDAGRQEDFTPVRIPDLPVGTLRVELLGDQKRGVNIPENELKHGAIVRIWGTIDHPVIQVE